MSKARTLAGVVSTGAVLADGTIDAAEIGNLTLPTGGDIVGTTATQTLTNKTIDIVSNTLTGVQPTLVSATNIKTVNSESLLGSGNISIPLTSPAGTTGQVQINNAGVFGAVASGTAGQVLTSAGAGAAPTFATPAAGGSMVFLEEVTASSSATVDLTAFSSTYDDYIVLFSGVSLSAIDWLGVRLSVGGSFKTASSYARALHYRRSDDPNYRQEQSTSSSIINVTTQASSETYWPIEGVLKILGVNKTNTTKGVLIESRYYHYPNNSQASATGHGIWGSDFGVVNGLRFLPLSGSNIAVGTFRLYGIKKS